MIDDTLMGMNRGGEVVSEEALRLMLGISKPVRLSRESMASGLRVTFHLGRSLTTRVRSFVDRLRLALAESGVQIVDPDAALTGSGRRKFKEDLVVIAAGDHPPGNLPVDHVANLRKNSLVGIYDGPCPTQRFVSAQDILNRIVQALAWDIVQTAIFVDDTTWTTCTMNGAIIACPNTGSLRSDVLSTLIPKLAAPVVPPHAADFDVQEGALDLSSPDYDPYVRDFVEGGPVWAATGLMLFHTSLDSLKFRSAFYRRVAAAYLDRRSGMSYGFLARQLAVPQTRVMTVEEGIRESGSRDWLTRGYLHLHDRLHVVLRLDDEAYLVEVPEVRVLSTRSGCDKSKIDGKRDLMLMKLSAGKVSYETPRGLSSRVDSKPSYDTMTILSHALGNALISGVLRKRGKGPGFSDTVRASGMGLAHWHGMLDARDMPQGYCMYGEDNPPVSCSTHQAAIYALSGKLSAFRSCLRQRKEYAGDVHVEPHHGVNVTWPTLKGLAQWLLEHQDGSGLRAQAAVGAVPG